MFTHNWLNKDSDSITTYNEDEINICTRKKFKNLFKCGGLLFFENQYFQLEFGKEIEHKMTKLLIIKAWLLM